MRCLWLTRRFPRPTTSGAFFYSGVLIDELATICELDVLTYVDDVSRRAHVEEPPVEGMRWFVVEAPTRARILSFVSPLPTEAYRYVSKDFVAALNQLVSEQTYDVILIEHIGMGWMLSHLKAALKSHGRDPALVYVSQNHEASVRKEVAAFASRNPLKQLYSGIDAIKAAKLEQGVIDACRGITAITDDDLKLFGKAAPDKTLGLFPAVFGGLPIAQREITKATPRRILALGSLLWHAKAESFLRFIELAKGPLTSAGIEMDVVGGAPKWLVEKIKEEHPWISCHGFVDDLAPFHSGARLGLMVDQVGGGFKTKLLDYFFNRTPVFGFADQLSGLSDFEEGRDYISEPTIEKLIDRVISSIDDLATLNDLQNAAAARAAAVFTRPALNHRMRDFFTRLLSTRV